jgi:hypothetical protein
MAAKSTPQFGATPVEFGDSCGNTGQYFGIYEFAIDSRGSEGTEGVFLVRESTN